jgi:hypothetical protein
MEASPAPKPARKRARWWLWGLALIVLVVGSAAIAVLSFPSWGAQRVRVALEERLTRRLGTPVGIDALQFDFESLRLEGVHIESPFIDLVAVRVELAEHMLWSLGAEAKVVELNAGRVAGTRAQLETLARTILEAAKDEDRPRSGWRGKVKLRPETLRVRGLDVELTADSGAIRAIRGRVGGEFRPRQELGSIRIEGAHVEAEFFGPRSIRARRIETKLERREGALVFPLQLQVEGGALALTEEISLADVDGAVTASDASLSEIEVDVTGGFGSAGADKGAPSAPKGDLWGCSGVGKRDLSAGSVTLAMERFELGRIPQVLEAMPFLVKSEQATVAGELSVDLAEGLADVDGKLRLDGLNLEHSVLAKKVVRDVDFEVDLRAKIDPAKHQIDVEELSVERRGARLVGSGVVVHPPVREERRYQLSVELPPTDCQVVLSAVPAEMVPSLQGLRVKGSYSAKIELDVDFAKLDDLSLTTKVRPRACKVQSVPPALSLARLRNGFTHRMTMRDGRQRMVRLFSGSTSYAALTQISPNMMAAVLTTEDAAFWRHSGFLPKQFGEALRRNLKAGRVRLGASTITMQMVKNVFLSHERTLSRKFQELVLTEYVERVLSKERIMELYLNVIEFGPGIYGVRAAAEHYFGKHPRELNSLEAAYLALMLPSPVRRHSHFCKGEMSASFQRKLRNIHRLMFARGHISEEEYLLWKDSELLYDPLRSVDRGSCLGEITRLLEAREGQHAITGLLGDDAPKKEDIQEEIEPRELPLPDLQDPANSDAPGVPAMDR